MIIHYYIMSYIMVDTNKDVKNSLGKLYMAIIMGALMVILEIFMHDFYFKHISTFYYLLWFIILGLFVYLSRNQIFINDNNYLREMIQHHSMAILTSSEIVKKTRNNNVKRLAENILSTQRNEIEIMNNLIGKID
jgi:tyrosine-protein phosphatase YwqE